MILSERNYFLQEVFENDVLMKIILMQYIYGTDNSSSAIKIPLYNHYNSKSMYTTIYFNINAC